MKRMTKMRARTGPTGRADHRGPRLICRSRYCLHQGFTVDIGIRANCELLDRR